MACLSPIKVVNPSKFLSKLHAERYLISVPCGRCAGCQTTKSNEYYFRTMYEYQDCVRSGGYMLFDTLTYRDKDLPTLSRFYPEIPKSLDFPCFSREDLRLFFVRLRRALSHAGYKVEDNLRYFVSSEYGTKKGKTHRSHYHVLFFVHNAFIPPLVLSKYISRCWKYGRTDGVPYKTRYYVLEHNVISSGLAQSIRVCKYVAKYVQKNSSFQKTIDARMTWLMRYFFDDKFTIVKDLKYELGNNHPIGIEFGTDVESLTSFYRSERGKKIKRDLVRLVNQFHLQSHGYGVSALEDIDLLDLEKTGTLPIVDNNKVVMRIALPMYYKRKLFYEKVELLGVQSWQPTELGLLFLQKREPYLIEQIANRYKTIALNSRLHTMVNFEALARYAILYKGRLKNTYLHSPTLELKSYYVKPHMLYYNYVTSCDKKQFGTPFVSLDYLGNDKNGYDSPSRPSYSLNDFIRRFVFVNPEFDKIIEDFEGYMLLNGIPKQDYYDTIQELVAKYQYLGLFNE